MIANHFRDAYMQMCKHLARAPEVHGQRWQGVDVSKRPEAKMVEALHQDLRIALPTWDVDHYRHDCKPNLPWADDHFQERVCGAPINPGVQWAKWPWGNSAANFLEEDGKFNHNYMERYWPKYAGIIQQPTKTADEWRTEFAKEYHMLHRGIRYFYGDLNDLIDHLADEPDTRQAYLPIFFPEDTGTMNPTRKPCSLGYQFILRHNHFHITYYMRSCDFYRHWSDDCYLTVRLLIWVYEKLKERDPDTWANVKPGFFNMHTTSLHCFINDLPIIKSKVGIHK